MQHTFLVNFQGPGNLSEQARVSPRAAWAVWVGLLGIAVLLVALRWSSCTIPLVRDEGEYAYAAQALGRGQLPYEHAFVQKPPLVILTYALANTIAPNLFWFPRVLSGLFAAAATALLGLAVRREFGPSTAMATMWFFTPMILLPDLEEYPANTEQFMLLPLMAVVALYACNRSRGGEKHVWAAAGACASLALLYKYTAAPLLAAVFILWTFDEWRRSRQIRPLLKNWGYASLGGGVVALAVLGCFLWHDGGKTLWECTVRFNRAYLESQNFGLDAFGRRLRVFWLEWRLPCLLPLALLLRPCTQTWRWGLLFLAACISTGMSIYGHYYLIVMPFWALLLAVAIDRLVNWPLSNWPRIACWLRRGAVALALALICRPDVSRVCCSPEEFTRQAMPGLPAYDSLVVADRIDHLSSPQSLVFVAGSEPQILRYARRLSPTRFTIMYPMTISTPLATGYQQEAIRDLERSSPDFIVAVQNSTSWLLGPGTPPEFMSYIRTLLDDRFDLLGGYVPSTDTFPGHWEEPLQEQHMSKASLLLYRRQAPTTRPSS